VRLTRDGLFALFRSLEAAIASLELGRLPELRDRLDVSFSFAPGAFRARLALVDDAGFHCCQLPETVLSAHPVCVALTSARSRCLTRLAFFLL
jgi:acetolactate synthase regulatory subunit